MKMTRQKLTSVDVDNGVEEDELPTKAQVEEVKKEIKAVKGRGGFSI